MEEGLPKDSIGTASLSHPRVEVLATFVADPVLEILRYWFSEFHYAAEFLPTSYGQFFTRLLGGAESFQAGDIHVVLFAVRDLIPEKDRGILAKQAHANVVELVNGLTAGVTARGGTWIVLRCPDPTTKTDKDTLGEFEKQAEYIAAQSKELAGTIYLDASDLRSAFGLESCFDDLADQHAHVPYTEAYYAAIGTTIFRAIRSRLGQVYKLIVTDCDDTLWDGNCGEGVPDELSILPHTKWLHKLLQSKKSAGMLLAICSQNNFDDVQAVFMQREDLGLALDDFTASKINWNDKSQNIQDLAQELHIALESVIFLDNDPVQRHQVRTTLPQVLVPELPAEPTEWPSYLEHLWGLDTFWVTEEAARRTSLYREHAVREKVRANSTSLSQFLKELQLQVSIKPATDKDIPRLFELVNRVTQFNVNGIRMKESDIGELILSKDGGWLAVQVEDRFGDYGLVGAVSYKCEDNFFAIDTFLLSCRALGRGVENLMLQAVGNLALENQVSLIRFAVAKTARNMPAMDFIKHLGMSESNLSTGWFQLNAADAATHSDTTYVEKSDSVIQSVRIPDESGSVDGHMMSDSLLGEADKILVAAKSVQDISGLYEKARLIGERAGQGANKTTSTPRTKVEKRVMNIFQQLLGHDNISVDEEFFDAGGHSLLAIRLLSRIRDAFGVDLPIRMLFMQRLTIANLAGIVEASSTPEGNKAQFDTIKNALDSFSDDEIAGLFGDLGKSEPAQN
jgi:FkbH-like protein